MTESVGGPIYIGDAPGGETFPEYDSTIDKNQIVKNWFYSTTPLITMMRKFLISKRKQDFTSQMF